MPSDSSEVEAQISAARNGVRMLVGEHRGSFRFVVPVRVLLGSFALNFMIEYTLDT